MKAVISELPVGETWSFEVKWDGMRVVTAIGDPRQPLRLDTTRGNDATDRFPELGGLPARLAPHRVVLDGEVVAFGEDGRPNFGLLQHRMHLARPADAARVAAKIPVCYVVFDVLWLDGQDLTGFAYLERRHLLTELVEPGDGLLVPAHQIGDGADLLEAARQSRLEGIVAKRIDSLYRPGARSPLWRKVKIRPRQEFVIGGWHPGDRGRLGQLGSLLIGSYEGAALRFAGKVGTGFKARDLDRLAGLLGALAADESPFTPVPPPVVARTARWVRPELVAEVTFGEWTDEGILRHASYIATRDDKEPRAVVRET